MAESFSRAPHAAIDDEERAWSLARDLLSIGAVDLRPSRPFTWSSGLRAPIYCDNRRTIAYPRIRRAICQGFAEVVRTHELGPATVAGTATAGIPHAAWLAEVLDAPMAYVRSSAKGHGQEGRIEGELEEGEDVILVEDLVSTGQSALEAVSALRAVGAHVRAVLSIFTYELEAAARAFGEADVPWYVLTNFRTLLEVAREESILSDEELEVLRSWQQDPAAWSEKAGGEVPAS